MSERAAEVVEAVVAHVSRCIHLAQAAASGIGLSALVYYLTASLHVLYSGVPESSNVEHVVVLHSDDVHSFEEVAHVLLAIVGASDIDAEQLAHQLDTQGEAIVKRGSQELCQALHEQICNATTGNSAPLMVSVQSELMERNEHLCVELLQWLSQLVTYSDNFVELVASTLDSKESHAPLHSQAGHQVDAQSTRLDAWISCDWMLRQKLGAGLHHLYMQLIPDPHFKAVFAQALLRCYCDLSSNYVQGKGSSENSIFNLTVQLFTVPSLVPQLVVEQDMLQIIFGSIGAAISSALDRQAKTVNPSHSVIRHARYVHLFNDLRYALSMPGVARHVTCGDSRLLASWLQMLSFVQLMDPNQHQTGAHVEYESESWLHAFDLSIKLSPIQALIVDGFIEVCKDLPHDQKCQNAHSVVSMCCSAINSWASAQNLELIELNSPLGAASVFDVNMLDSGVSFHLPLHRFLTLLLLECITKLQIDPAEFLRLKYLPPTFVALLMEWPLQSIVVAAQTKIGMWKRNGHTILNQVINYQHSAVAAHMCDLDLPLVQFGASTLPASMFLSTVLHRFGLYNWWWQKDPSSGSQVELANECLSTLVVIFSEVDWYSSDQLKRLQRELVHKMLVGPCTHSKLRECISSFGSKKGSPTSEEFDVLLNKLASFHTPTKVAQGKYELKDAYKPCYDPYFFHLTREQHQIANENLSCQSAANATPLQGHFQSPCLPKAMYGMAAILLSSEIAEMLWCPIRDVQDPTRCSSEVLQAALHLFKLSAQLLQDESMPSEWRDAFVAALELDRHGDSIVSKLCSLSHQSGNQHAKQLVQMLSCVSDVCKSSCLNNTKQSEASAKLLDEANGAEIVAASIKETKKLAARKRAIAAMKKKRDRFSKAQVSEEHNQSNLLSNSTVDVAPTEEKTELLCILCRDECDKGVLGHLAFAQLGGPLQLSNQSAVHIQFCSHCMHLSCHAQYMQALKQRHSGMQDFEGQHVIDLTDGEFLCPMCKSVCNMLIPNRRHKPQEIPLSLSDQELMEKVGSWYDTECTDQLQSSALKSNELQSVDSASLVMAKQIAGLQQLGSEIPSPCSSPPVAMLSQCWLSVSCMIASVWLCSKKPEPASVSAMRSVLHSVRALSNMWWTDLSPHHAQFVEPMACLLQGGSSHSQPGVAKVFAGPTLLGSNLLEVMVTLMLLAPSAHAAIDTLRALFVVAIVQATLSPVDHANSISMPVQSSTCPDLEVAAALTHNSVCEFAGIAPRYL